MEELSNKDGNELQINGEILQIIRPKPLDAGLKVPTFLNDEDKDYVNFLFDFLNMPYILDRFEDHQERRRWRHTLNQEDRIFYERNRLRMNNIASVLQIFQLLLLKYPGRFDLEYNDIEVLSETLRTNWHTMNNNEKIKCIEEDIVPMILKIIILDGQ